MHSLLFGLVSVFVSSLELPDAPPIPECVGMEVVETDTDLGFALVGPQCPGCEYSNWWYSSGSNTDYFFQTFDLYTFNGKCHLNPLCEELYGCSIDLEFGVIYYGDPSQPCDTVELKSGSITVDSISWVSTGRGYVADFGWREFVGTCGDTSVWTIECGSYVVCTIYVECNTCDN